MADNLKGIPFSSGDEGTNYPELAKQLVYDCAVEYLLEQDPTFSVDDVYVVWFNYTLGNWKVLCSTTLPDGRYYEISHSAARGLTFIDTYLKTDNTEVKKYA